MAINNADDYEIGVNAAWRGESIDAMPKFQKSARSSAWLKGFADGQRAQKEHRERGAVNKSGLKKLFDVMRGALEEPCR